MNCVVQKKQEGETKMNGIVRKKQKGERKMKRAFTLIELMIVMAVIAILVGIALPRFKGMREEANITKAHGELRALKIAMESYAMHHGNIYPGTHDNPYATYLNGTNCKPGPQLIESVLYDPFAAANTEYYYVLGTGTGEGDFADYYAICSRGLDGNADVDGADVGNGELAAAEILDDIVASNCLLLP